MAARRADLSVEEEDFLTGSTGIPACVFSETRAGMPVPQKFPCGIAAGPIDGDCLTPLYGGGLCVIIVDTPDTFTVE